MSRTFEQAVTLTRLSAGTRFNRLAVLVTEPDNTKRMQHDPATVNTSTQQINVGGVRRGDSLTVALDGDHVYTVGDDVYVTDAGNIDRFVAGRVTAAEAGSVTIEVKRRAGIGAASDWVVIVALGLLVEGGATNELPHSENFSDSYWTKDALTIVSSAEPSPSGENNGYVLEESGTESEIHRIRSQPIAYDSEQSLSVFLKHISRRFVRFTFGGQSNSPPSTERSINIDLLNGVVISDTSHKETAKMVRAANGYWLITFVTNSPAELTQNRFIVSMLNDNLEINYVSEGRQIGIWGAQQETALRPTSYIKTTDAPATRAPDVVSQGEVGKWLNTADFENTFIFETTPTFTNDQVVFSLVSPTTNSATTIDIIRLRKNSAEDFSILVNTPSGQASSGTEIGYYTPGERYRFVVIVTKTSVQLFEGGNSFAKGSGDLSTLPDFENLRYGGRSDTTPQITSNTKVIPYALTEAEAIEASKL